MFKVLIKILNIPLIFFLLYSKKNIKCIWTCAQGRLHVEAKVVIGSSWLKKKIIILYKFTKFYDFFTLKKILWVP